MRMSAARMHKIEKASRKLSITKLVKEFIPENYSDNVKTCRYAIIKAIKWSRNRQAHLARVVVV